MENQGEKLNPILHPRPATQGRLPNLSKPKWVFSYLQQPYQKGGVV